MAASYTKKVQFDGNTIIDLSELYVDSNNQTPDIRTGVTLPTSGGNLTGSLDPGHTISLDLYSASDWGSFTVIYNGEYYSYDDKIGGLFTFAAYDGDYITLYATRTGSLANAMIVNVDGTQVYSKSLSSVGSSGSYDLDITGPVIVKTILAVGGYLTFNVTSMVTKGNGGGVISTKAGSITIPAGIYSGGSVAIDNTEQDKIISGNIKSGVTILGVTGATNVIDTTSSTPAAATQVLSGKRVFVNGSQVTGSMTNRGAGGGNITTKAGSITIPAGYYSGSGSVAISSTEQAKIIAGNIKSGVTILGVAGTYSGDAPSYTVTSASVNDVASDKSFYAADSTTTVTMKTGNLLDWRSSTNTLSTWDGSYLSNISYVSSGLKVVPPFNLIISGQYDTIGGDPGPNNGVYIDNTSLRMAIGLMSNPGDTSASSKIVTGYTIAGVTGTGGGSTPSYVTTNRASASEVLSGKYFYYPNSASTVTRTAGSMTNNGAVSQTLTINGASYTIPAGYHNGSGHVYVSIPVYDGSVIGGGLAGTTWLLNSTPTAGGLSDGSNSFDVNYTFDGLTVNSVTPTLTTFDIGLQHYGPTGTEYLWTDLSGTCSVIQGAQDYNVSPSEFVSTLDMMFDPKDGYYSDTVYIYSDNSNAPFYGWTFNNRTISFIDGDDINNSDLIAWLEANGVQQ